jgi:hypothetical protein
MPWIKKTDAFESIRTEFPNAGLDDKVLENWIKSGEEIAFVKQGNRNGFTDTDLDSWKRRIGGSSISLNREDYKKCFVFAVEAYYSTMTRADFNRGKQRDVGEFLTNQVQGKLGEIAIQKHLAGMDLNIQLDFTVNGMIPSQDITQVSTRRNVWNNPAIKVSIKTTKLKNVLLAIPEGEIAIPDRRSDMYILTQVGLFPDHILRIIKQFRPDFLVEHIDLIPDFGEIPARIGGWISYDDLVQNGPMLIADINNHFGITMADNNFIKVTGQLSTEWLEMKNRIVG